MQQIDDDRFDRVGIRPDMTMEETVAEMCRDFVLAMLQTDRQRHLAMKNWLQE
jgi:hypothetical protein